MRRADHWAARREQVSLFGHFWRIRTACQRCVQVAAPYKWAHGPPTPAKTKTFRSSKVVGLMPIQSHKGKD